MNLTDIKIYAFNGINLMISFTNIDVILKIILLSVTILYTLHKWYLMNENKKE